LLNLLTTEPRSGTRDSKQLSPPRQKGGRGDVGGARMGVGLKLVFHHEIMPETKRQFGTPRNEIRPTRIQSRM